MLATERRTSSTGLFLVLVLAAAAILVLFAFRDLPKTQHALNGHTGQRWDVTAISEHFDAGRCIPQEYACMAADFNVVFCELSPGKAIGLVIGRTVQQIVTGFAASTDYWSNRCER